MDVISPAAAAAPPAATLKQRAGLLAAVALLAIILLLPAQPGLPPAGQVILGILAFSIVVWITELDYAFSAVVIAALMVFLPFVVSIGFILPVNSPQAMIAHGTGSFDARGFVRTGFVLTLAATGLPVLLALSYWSWLGYMTASGKCARCRPPR